MTPSELDAWLTIISKKQYQADCFADAIIDDMRFWLSLTMEN